MSRIQKYVAMSTTEAEYMAITEAGKELVWLNNFLEELDRAQTECRTLSLKKILGAKNPADMLTKVETTEKIPCIESLLALCLVSAACSVCSAVHEGAIYRTEVCTEVCADRRLSISEEALGAFGKSQTYSGSDEMRYSFRDTKSYQVIQIRDITFVDSIYGASSEITQSPGGSSDTSKGSENSGSFKDSGRSDEEYSKDGASSKEEGSETPQWKKAIIEEIVSLEKNLTCSLVTISARKKALQRLWMFKVKEEHNGRKRYKARLVVKGFQQKRGEPSYVGALNDTFTQHKSKGFQLAG
ncbi:retrovirus-related pol polyprotein from transposon TNT 1-94 [Tanacetum coccineum]